MAKKKRHRIWWFGVYADQYEELKKARRLPVPQVLFDKTEMAYGAAYADRFDVKMKDDETFGKIAVTNEEGYAQLQDQGKIIVIGIHGDAINWKKNVSTMRAEEGGGESIFLEQDIEMTDKVVAKVLEESDEMYHRHLTSPLAKAGGITVPEWLETALAERKAAAAEAAAALAAEEASKLEEDKHGEDDGEAADASATEGHPSEA